MNLPTREQVARAHGAVLKSLREGTTHLTQEQLAEASDTDPAYVSLQERGERSPNLWVFLKTAHGLNVDPVLLLMLVLARLRNGS